VVLRAAVTQGDSSRRGSEALRRTPGCSNLRPMVHRTYARKLVILAAYVVSRSRLCTDSRLDRHHSTKPPGRYSSPHPGSNSPQRASPVTCHLWALRGRGAGSAASAPCAQRAGHRQEDHGPCALWNRTQGNSEEPRIQIGTGQSAQFHVTHRRRTLMMQPSRYRTAGAMRKLAGALDKHMNNSST
jgi:hypothetical protein